MSEVSFNSTEKLINVGDYICFNNGIIGRFIKPVSFQKKLTIINMETGETVIDNVFEVGMTHEEFAIQLSRGSIFAKDSFVIVPNDKTKITITEI